MFAWTPILGPSKVVAVESDLYKIEYFYSPWKSRTISQDKDLSPYELIHKTRVYVKLEDV